jgi:hypothetical protein
MPGGQDQRSTPVSHRPRHPPGRLRMRGEARVGPRSSDPDASVPAEICSPKEGWAVSAAFACSCRVAALHPPETRRGEGVAAAPASVGWRASGGARPGASGGAGAGTGSCPIPGLGTRGVAAVPASVGWRASGGAGPGATGGAGAGTGSCPTPGLGTRGVAAGPASVGWSVTCGAAGTGAGSCPARGTRPPGVGEQARGVGKAFSRPRAARTVENGTGRKGTR